VSSVFLSFFKESERKTKKLDLRKRVKKSKKKQQHFKERITLAKSSLRVRRLLRERKREKNDDDDDINRNVRWLFCFFLEEDVFEKEFVVVF
jgi:hypothetical protein